MSNHQHNPHTHPATGDHGPHTTYIGNMLDPQTGDQAFNKTFANTVDKSSHPLGPEWDPKRMDVPVAECPVGDGQVELTDEEIARRAATNTGSRSTLDGAQAGVAERHRVDPRVDGPLRSEGGVTGQFREGHEHEQKEHKKPGLIDKLLGRDLEPLERESR